MTVQDQNVVRSSRLPSVPNYGIDADRVLAGDSLPAAIRRRVDGRYAVDEFGGDPHLMDLVSPMFRWLRISTWGEDHVPARGPALLIANRGFGVLEPMVLAQAIRRKVGRRLRVVGAPEAPVLGATARRLGAIGYRPDDVAAMLRAGHLAAAPLGPTWFSSGVGSPPGALIAATLGFPVVPAAILPGGPLGLPMRPWRVRFGEPIRPPTGTQANDLLAAAELAEETRAAVRRLIDQP